LFFWRMGGGRERGRGGKGTGRRLAGGGLFSRHGPLIG
jgi:hypothetical protein